MNHFPLSLHVSPCFWGTHPETPAVPPRSLKPVSWPGWLPVCPSLHTFWLSLPRLLLLSPDSVLFFRLCSLRKQLQELSAQHQQELSTHLAQFKVEMAEREERQQQVAQDYELRYWIWSVAVCPQSQWEWRGAACFVDVAPAPFRISRLTCLSGSSCSPRLCFLKGSTSPLASLFQTGPGAGTSAGTAEWEPAAGGAASGAGRATPGHAAGPLGGGKPAAQRHLPAAPPPGRPRP